MCLDDDDCCEELRCSTWAVQRVPFIPTRVKSVGARDYSVGTVQRMNGARERRGSNGRDRRWAWMGRRSVSAGQKRVELFLHATLRLSRWHVVVVGVGVATGKTEDTSAPSLCLKLSSWAVI